MNIQKVSKEKIKTYPIENRSNSSVKPDWIQDSFIFKEDIGTEFDVKISTRKSYTDSTIVTRMVLGKALRTKDRVWFDSNAFIGKIVTLLEEKASPATEKKPPVKKAGGPKGNKKHLEDKNNTVNTLVDTTQNEPGHAIRYQIRDQHERALKIITL